MRRRPGSSACTIFTSGCQARIRRAPRSTWHSPTAPTGEIVRKAAEARLRDDFKLEHVTIQTERAACPGGDEFHT